MLTIPRSDFDANADDPLIYLPHLGCFHVPYPGCFR